MTLLLIIIISVTQPDSVMPAWPVGIGWHGINWLQLATLIHSGSIVGDYHSE